MYGKYLPTKLCDVWGQMRVNVPYIYYIGVFHGSPKSWGYPSNHPVVLDDHDLVLTPLTWLGVHPHFRTPPHGCGWKWRLKKIANDLGENEDLNHDPWIRWDTQFSDKASLDSLDSLEEVGCVEKQYLKVRKKAKVAMHMEETCWSFVQKI